MLVNINMFSLILDFVGENPIIFNFIRIPRFGPFYNIYIYNLNSVLYCLLMFIFLLDKLYHIYAMLCLIFKNIIIFSIILDFVGEYLYNLKLSQSISGSTFSKSILGRLPSVICSVAVPSTLCFLASVRAFI